MSKYRVSSLYMNGELLGKHGKVFRSGDEITEKEFPEGNFDKLVKGGWIEKIGKGSEPKEAETETTDSQLPDIAEMTIKEVAEWAEDVSDIDTLETALSRVDTKGGEKAIKERIEELG